MNDENLQESNADLSMFKTQEVPIPARPKIQHPSTGAKQRNIPETPLFRPILPSKSVEQIQAQQHLFIAKKTELPEPITRNDPGSIYLSNIPTIDLPGIDQISLPQTPKHDTLLSEKERHLSEKVETYAAWLVRQAARPKLQKDQEEKNLYLQEATQTIKLKGQEINTFAPFRAELSAFTTFTKKQILVLATLGISWFVGLYFFHLEMITALIGAITVIYTLCLLINVFLVMRTFNNQPEEKFDDALVDALKSSPWPKYTILCPLYKEAAIVPQFVSAMERLDYPTQQLQILLLTEEHDRETRKAIRDLHLPAHFEIVVVPDGQPRTKPRACNYGLLKATGEYVVIYDAEDIPDPLQLKKAVLSFANNDINTVCVQAKLNFYNSKQNLLTRWFTAEYSVWFGFILPALQMANFVLPLGGTSNHFRTASLRALGGWDAYNVTEDCDLGLRLKRFSMKTVILDSTTLEEANPNLKNWLRQRSRWIKGYMQTYLVHMRTPIKTLKEGRLKDAFSFQVVIGSGIGVLFFNPMMWILLIIYGAKRAEVINLYHLLFPGPFLYLGLICLIFGNFFYIYLYLLGCVKRKDYSLLLPTLLIPIYWLLMSIAGIYGFIELLTRPHYWQKTVHGLHIKGTLIEQTKQEADLFVQGQTQTSMPALPAFEVEANVIVRSITSSMKAISTLPMPAISIKQKHAERAIDKVRIKDLWLYAIILISSLASIIALFYYYQHSQILLYGDAHSHLGIARRMFDSSNPYDITQLGAVWLPLPHMLMWPFIWNDFLWRSGLAGSFVSMPCYVITTCFIYKSAFRLTRNEIASFIGTLAFALNPDILYIQVTPLSELVCAATFTGSCYFFLCWTQENKTKFLVYAAIFTFLATWSRYDGWAVFLVLFLLIFVVGFQKRLSFNKIISNAIIYGSLGGFGIILWLTWSQVIFGDALYFQNGPYSSQAQQLAFLKLGRLYTYHNLFLSIKYYAGDFIETLGPIICIIAAFGLIILLLKLKFFYKNIAVLSFLTPLPFYVYSLYSGQAIIYVPGLVPKGAISQVFNVRYGIAMAPAISILLAILITLFSLAFSSSRIKKVSFTFAKILLLFLIIFQVFITAKGGNIALQDGQYGISCEVPLAANTYLAEYYNGGKVLEDNFASRVDGGDAGFDFKDVIYEGSGNLWINALKNPEEYATWIVAYPSNPFDLVSQEIPLSSKSFLSNYTLVVSGKDGVVLYHRNSDALKKVHNVSSEFLSQYSLCAPH